MTNSPIASPCIRNCCLNDDDICIGCYRSLQEITQWGGASDHTKSVILLAAARRAEERRGKQNHNLEKPFR